MIARRLGDSRRTLAMAACWLFSSIHLKGAYCNAMVFPLFTLIVALGSAHGGRNQDGHLTLTDITRALPSYTDAGRRR